MSTRGKRKSSHRGTAKKTSHKTSVTDKLHGSSGSKSVGKYDVDYAAKGSKKSTTSKEGRSSKYHKNILDKFFAGIDRNNELQDEYRKIPEFLGYAWDPEMILNSVGITLSRLTSKVLNVSRININHAPSQVDFTNFGKMYAFFTKPDLYLFTDDKFTVNQTIQDNAEDLYAMIKKNIPVASALQIGTGKVPSYGSSGGLNTLLGNLCNEIEVPDVQMSTTPGPKNGKGTSISYVGDFFESLQEGSISISFIDTRDRDVSTQLEIWATYAEMERRGLVFKKPDYIGKNIIDYACTIFIFCVDESNNILAWIPLIGCFPTSMNTDLLKYRATQLVAQDFIGPFNWTFHVSYVGRPNVHKTMVAFNYITGYGEKILKGSDKNMNAHKMMYKKKGDYWFHTGVTMDVGYITDYPYHFTLEDKWAEMVGVSQSIQSSGVINYTLSFCSRNLGTPVTQEDFWTGQYHYETGSRWKDGAYIKADMSEIDLPGEYTTKKRTASGEVTYLPSDRSFGSIGAMYNFGSLDFSAAYEPYSFSGAGAMNGGVYQGNWNAWNLGNNRYGQSTSRQSNDNSNTFRNALRALAGLRF